MPSGAARQIDGLPNVNPFEDSRRYTPHFLQSVQETRLLIHSLDAVYIFPLSHAESERLVMPLSEPSYNGILTVFALDVIEKSPQCTYL